jgi:F-type H+-transporting ATPase subunit epsilon
MTYTLKIVTPDEVFFEGQVVHTEVPGALGYLGILAHHAPLVTPIEKGNLTYRDEQGKTEVLKVEGGFLEVSKNKVLVLTDRVQK